MGIKFRKNAIKFLEKADIEDTARIREKINQLLIFVEEQGIMGQEEMFINVAELQMTRIDWMMKNISCD